MGESEGDVAAGHAAVDTEDRRKHLEFIQGAVNRMAASSSTAKAWLLPVATATYGYALTRHGVADVALLGIMAVFVFGGLDAHYLRQERAFRALYRAAVEGDVAMFEMSNGGYFRKPNRDEEDRREENCRWRAVMRSWSLTGFYLPLGIVGVAVVVRAAS